MGWIFGILAVTLGIVFVWGLVAPRSQWRVLSAWSVSDEHAHEPGGTAYGWRRFVSGVGVLAMAAVVGVAASSAIADLPSQAAPPADRIADMWGTPHPDIVDRMISPVAAESGGLVLLPTLGYQEFDEEDGIPDYLDGLDAYEYLGKLEVPGLIGAIPDVGFSGLDFANIVVHVRGPILCVPRQVVVLESETAVKIGVYYGAPDPADGSVPDNATACAVDPSVTSSVLIPLALSAPVGDRVVTNLDDTEIENVPAPDVE